MSSEIGVKCCGRWRCLSPVWLARFSPFPRGLPRPPRSYPTLVGFIGRCLALHIFLPLLGMGAQAARSESKQSQSNLAQQDMFVMYIYTACIYIYIYIYIYNIYRRSGGSPTRKTFRVLPSARTCVLACAWGLVSRDFGQIAWVALSLFPFQIDQLSHIPL